MDWSSYSTLLAALLLSVPAFLYARRHLGELCEPSPSSRRTELALVGLVVLVGLVAVYGRFFLGEAVFSYRDVGSDTSEQYVPYYLSLLRAIREGTLGAWNFDYGLGSSFMSYQSWTLDPFNLIVVPLCLVFGDSFLSVALVCAQSAKVLACAYLFDQILVRYCSLPLTRALGSSLFAFCGYLILWGQHYWLGTVLVMATALVLSLELLMERWSVPRFLAVMAATALSVLMSTYSGFMIMLFAATYALLRLACLDYGGTAGGYLRAYLRLATPVVCGLLVSALTVIPYATLLLGESARISSEGSASSNALGFLTEFVPLRWLPAMLSRLLGSGLVCTTSDYPPSVIPPTDDFAYVNVYEFIQLGFSVACLILLGQFFRWVFREGSRRTRAVVSVATLLCLLYCVNFFLPALTNAFVEPKYRSSFVLSIPLCLAMAVGWERSVMAQRVSRPVLLACAALTALVLAWSFANAVDGRLECAAYAVCLAAIVLLLLAPRRALDAGTVALLLCLAIVSSSVVDGFFVTNRRVVSTQESLPGTSETNADTEAALSWLRENDDGLYRVEKLYTNWTRLNDALVEGYHGISSYNSTLDEDVIDFYRNLWPGALVGESAYQEFINDPDQPQLLQLLGVKYLLAHDQLPFTWCEQVAEFGDVLVYQVKGTTSLLSVRTGVISEGDVAEMTPQARTELLAACALVPDDVAAELALSPSGNAEPTTSGSTVEGPSGAIIVEPDTSQLSLTGSSTVSGSFSALADGSVAVFAVPNTAGWKVLVDGTEVETFRADYGFIGFTVSAGRHSFEAKYEVPNLSLGAALAGVGLAAALVSCAVVRRGELRRARGQEPARG